MPRYQSIQFSPDGDYITDYHCQTVEEVWDLVADQGSRWFFYPIPFVITDGNENIERKRVRWCPEGWGHLEGCSVAAVAKAIRDAYIQEGE